MAIKKKKKKEELDASLIGWYVPGIQLSSAMKLVRRGGGSVGPWTVGSFKIIYSGRETYDPDFHPIVERHLGGQFLDAWWEYTGVPAAVGGGAGALAIQILAQAPQAKWASPFLRYGFMAAWMMEATAGAAGLALALTIIDPAHKWEGGLDELALGVIHPTTSKDIIMGLGSWGTVV